MASRLRKRKSIFSVKRSRSVSRSLKSAGSAFSTTIFCGRPRHGRMLVTIRVGMPASIGPLILPTRSMRYPSYSR